MAFEDQINNLQDEITQAIEAWVPSSDTEPTKLHEAMNYSMEAGGKRLRPALILAASRLSGPPPHDPLPAAVAVECLHTYSLIHDDLPSMDNSDFRRGCPSCHKAFDPATAILAGDALLTLTFEILAKAYADSPALGLRLIQVLSRAAGSEKLVGGQMRDIIAERTRPDLQELYEIHSGKTAALFSACLEMGGILGEFSVEELEHLSAAGHAIGIAFQIVDDVLDATQSQEQLGKQSGLDERNDTLTTVSLLGLDGARAKAREWTEKALQSIRAVGGENQLLLDLVAFLEYRMK